MCGSATTGSKLALAFAGTYVIYLQVRPGALVYFDPGSRQAATTFHRDSDPRHHARVSSRGLVTVDLQEALRGPGRAALASACLEPGVFLLEGHGVDPQLVSSLAALSRRFFALPARSKQRIEMARARSAWRGYFSLGEELTQGMPDQKEGLYFGAELPADHPDVLAGLPMHGPNLFPEQLPQMRDLVLSYMRQMAILSASIMKAVAVSLGFAKTHFERWYPEGPLELFRVFRYPPTPRERFGVGAHTDYGFLTVLWQSAPGLQIQSAQGWTEVPARPGAFVCNMGDMLARVTEGRCRAAPHRVISGDDRVAMAYFFDPSFRAEVGETRYGDYLLSKVAKVFPELQKASL